ncbi:RNA polymerase subunit sigma-70 [Actinosynnema pretiosum]|uniref:RNA polymerase subunit sigma-70 n=1 Tax=Actinosynnema pretiosum TaxID=42197 RepID=A0A290Z506_9PSEU|nr:RNA polymerase sigma factor [Actinosynnema pretiosum]ATE54110.1 RNA polymerase subunit sigma-70 [Actinosynnema pretiosum]
MVDGAEPGAGPPDNAEAAWESDAELWRRAAHERTESARAAFTALFERHAEAVWNHAHRLTASWTAADDLLSQVFLAAWRSRAKVVLTRDSALPWLYTVTANLVRAEHRSGSRLRQVLRLVGPPAPQRDHAERVADADAAEDRLRRVVAAVDRLPRSEREIARLCLLGGVGTADAAQLLRITEASVRSRVARARARLRDLTEEDDRG